MFVTRFIGFVRASARLLLPAFACCSISTATYAQDDVDAQFGFEEIAWSDPNTFEFTTTLISEPGNTWGDVEENDFYIQATSAADKIDVYIPGTQFVRDEDIIVVQFESRYLENAANHSYLAFGSDSDPDDAIFVGHSGGRFYAGTGTDFDLSSSEPQGVNIVASFDSDQAFEGVGSLVDDSRIGVRIGYDVGNQAIRNLQVDVNGDGHFDQEFIDPAGGDDLNVSGVGPLDWLLITYAGAGEARADNVSVVQQPIRGDFNNDLDYDTEDIDILCRDGVVAGDVSFDFNGDGAIDINDVNLAISTSGSIPGDVDFNNAVDFADFLVFSENFGQEATYSQGDLNCDGTAEFADFLVLASFFGSASSPPEAQAFHSVPEPKSTLSLFLTIVGCMLVRRKRR